jgi:uncharacterized protein (DUF924 family)
MATPTDATHPGWADDVLGFWFALPADAWFARSDDLDRQCAERFAGLHAHLVNVAPAEACASPRTALAAVVVLDQFSRNMFRGTPRAFESDASARAIAAEAIARGYDAGLSTDERCFLYLPFEHSEEAADQARSVGLFTALGDANYLSYAKAHKDIIDRFGRFPHRNAILGRPSTPAELAFLAQPGSSF